MVKAKKTTIHDVAKAANVSIAAVSFALNGKGTLSQATREHIIATAEHIGYQADALARGLRRSRLGAIGIVNRSLDLLGEYFLPGIDAFDRTISTLSALALQRGLAPVVLPDLTGASIPAISLALDGYIIVSPQSGDPVLELLDNREIPYACIGFDPSQAGFRSWASEDDAESCLQVMEHFRRQGAQHPSLLRGESENSWNVSSEQAYRTWCAAQGVQPQVHVLDESSGVAGAVGLFDKLWPQNKTDAIYAMTARHAVGIVTAALDQGVDVPGELLVATGSDSEAARFSRPAISAIQLNPNEVCADALNLLIERMEEREPSGPVLRRAKFRPRSSSLRR
ncbi:LacI family transcriptional regulator [Glutamicibacter uratoxydans]|uniref:LacI family transcriptional regulator n=1 Tax=Glutamicibacter uratoxydans TaxID=43667 RepID=A0A4Y4DIB5_GLUUR|nr:LacI family DNA-binding transcriptional regulator [Glutamicibacter uratoxydans]GED04992.1 LacI family transcriptional regulator [Glutamicibacter uratoxydans]